jgi:hypothetical protein
VLNKSIKAVPYPNLLGFSQVKAQERVLLIKEKIHLADVSLLQIKSVSINGCNSLPVLKRQEITVPEKK